MPVADRIWEPIPRQAELLRVPDSVFEVMYGGAAGGGKSDALVLLPIARQFYQHPNFKGLILRRTYPELEKEIIIRSKLWYPAAGGTYNEQKKHWVFPSGAVIQFGHCENEDDVRKYDSAEYNYAAFDELTSFTEWQYTYIAFTRVRTASPDLPVIVRSGTNPGNIGHGWVRKRFVEPHPDGGVIIKDKKTGLLRMFIPSKATDNPHLDAGYTQRLQMLGEAERRAKADGDWWTFEGQVFDQFRENKFEDEPPNAIHVIDPFEIPDWWPRVAAIDWGYSAMTWGGVGAISPDHRLYVYDEYHCKQTNISTWATEIGLRFKHPNLRSVVLCRSAWQKRGDDLTIAEQFRKHSGFDPALPDNDRVSGKILMQEYIRWQQKPVTPPGAKEEYSPERAQEILRKHGLDTYKKYLASFEPSEPETNIPRLQIFRNCTQLIKAIQLCVYDEDHKEDVAEFDGDDPYDGGRYLVKEADRYMRENPQDRYQQKLGEITKRFQETGDYTVLHRQLERVRPNVVRPVRRFRRGHRVA